MECGDGVGRRVELQLEKKRITISTFFAGDDDLFLEGVLPGLLGEGGEVVEKTSWTGAGHQRRGGKIEKYGTEEAFFYGGRPG